MRRSIRLKGYDYAQPGAYFVTVVTHARLCLFAEIVNGEARLNRWGRIVKDEWFRTIEIRPRVRLDETDFVVMPNHVHGIIWLMEDAVGARRRRAPTLERFGAPTLDSIPTILRSFKAVTTRRINLERSTPGNPLWQRNYYEHVIRGDAQLAQARRYVAGNPLQWEIDRANPDARRRRRSLAGADGPW